MASAPLMHPALPLPLRLPTRRADRRRWPVSAPARWGLRLALAVPYLVLAGVLTARDLPSGVNVRLEESGELIRWGSRDLGEFIGHLYPPVPTAVASLLPGGAVALGWVGALVAGVALHAVWERLHVRQLPSWLIVVLLVTFGLTPAFAYLATEDLAGFIGLGLFAVALTAFLRFATDGDTEAGFVCGLALALAVACDPVGLIYALFLGVSAAPVALQRYRGEPHSARASALVIAFPAVAALAGWTFLQWRFTGSPLGWLNDTPGTFEFADGVWYGLYDAARRGGIGLLLSPLFLVTQALLVRRRREAVFVALLPAIGMTVSLWLGLRVAAGHTVVLLGLIALVSVPRRPSPRSAALLATTAVAGYVLVVARVTTSNGILHDWLSALFA